MSQPTLLLTRPEAQSREFLSDCEKTVGRPLSSLISPILAVVAVGELPDLTRYRSVIVTSGNSVRRLGAALSGCRVFTVGDATAGLARLFGAEAIALGESIEMFLGAAETIQGPMLYCRGRHSRGRLAENLADLGHEVDEAIIYDQAPQPLRAEALSLLKGSSPVVAPVFSPRSASLLSDYVITAPITVLAMSQAVREAWHAPGEVRIAANPTSKEMQRLVAEAF